MEAKTWQETVMNEQQKINVMGIALYNASYMLNELCEAQAEISFSLGEKQGRQEGRKEVVEWFEKKFYNWKKNVEFAKEWQAQLKIWEVEDGTAG